MALALVLDIPLGDVVSDCLASKYCAENINLKLYIPSVSKSQIWISWTFFAFIQCDRVASVEYGEDAA